jgi:hypothetical protein
MWKFGNIKTGLVEEEIDKIKKIHDNINELYNTCDVSKCGLPDKKFCTRAFCLAENLQYNGAIDTPRKSWCMAQAAEYNVWKYFVDKVSENKERIWKK